MKVFRLAHNLSVIDAVPHIPGFEGFIGIYALTGKETALFDVGPSTSMDSLLGGLREIKVDPAEISYVLMSHVHMDHAGALGKLIKQMPRARVIVHERGAHHLIDPTRLYEESKRALGDLAIQYGPIEPVPRDRLIIGRDGMILNIGEAELEILETPGHATHHLSFFDRHTKRLFAGEAAGVYLRDINTVRPAMPFPFNIEHALDSLDRLISLNAEDLCYAHFGNAEHGTERLRKHKQQLILWGRIIADCREQGADQQAMCEEISRHDATFSAIELLPPGQRERERDFVRNSINGFVAYFEKYGTGILKRV